MCGAFSSGANHTIFVFSDHCKMESATKAPDWPDPVVITKHKFLFYFAKERESFNVEKMLVGESPSQRICQVQAQLLKPCPWC